MENTTILLFGLIVSLVAMMLSRVRAEYAGLCALCGAVIILIAALQKTDGILDFLTNLQQKTSFPSEYYALILKCMGICILSELATAVANDHHHSSLAQSMGYFTRVLLLGLALPVLQDVIAAMEELLK